MPLSEAVGERTHAVLEVTLAAGTDAAFTNPAGVTLLMLMARENTAEMLTLLLKAGADVRTDPDRYSSSRRCPGRRLVSCRAV